MTEFNYFAANPDKSSRLSHVALAKGIRDQFQIDRDRILYSKAFRRLRGKTQIFIAGYDDHVRNRLSHTLEVSQIACTISKALGLNVTLTEAIALGHDLGHTPFGHVGERVLHEISCKELRIGNKPNTSKLTESGFKHNWQSVRVANDLELHNRQYKGLNLTKETLWGFLHHSSLKYAPSKYTEAEKQEVPFYESYKNQFNDELDWTFEAFVVSIADEIAQRHHDIDDGLITGILEKISLADEIINRFKGLSNSNKDNLINALEESKKEPFPEFYLQSIASAIVNFYVQTVVEHTGELLNEIKEKYTINDSESFYKNKSIIWNDYTSNSKKMSQRMLSNELEDVDDKLQKDYFRSRILLSYQAQKSDGKAAYIIKKIVEAYLTNPQQMPDTAIINLFIEYKKKGNDEGDNVDSIMKIDAEKQNTIGSLRQKLDDLWKEKEARLDSALIRTVIDYVAGMTDDYAIAIYEQLYGGIKQNRY